MQVFKQISLSLKLSPLLVFGCALLGNHIIGIYPSFADDSQKISSQTTSKTPPMNQEDLKKVVATYGDTTLTNADVDKEIDRQPRLALFLQQNPSKKKELRASVVNAMINRALLLKEAKQAQVVKDDEVTTYVEKFVQQYGGKEKLDELLQGVHSDYATFTGQIADDFRLQKYVDTTIVKDVKVDPKEAEAAFKSDPTKYSTGATVRARHILVKFPRGSSPEEEKTAKAKIDSLYQDALKPNADFAELAKKNSDDPGSGQKGGELGFFGKGMMVPEFEQAAFSQKVGEIGKPIQTDFGFHIIQVEETKPAEAPSFEKAKPQIETALLSEKKESIVNAKLKDLREKAGVKIVAEG